MILWNSWVQLWLPGFEPSHNTCPSCLRWDDVSHWGVCEGCFPPEDALIMLFSEETGLYDEPTE